jgi:hypothetical protein
LSDPTDLADALTVLDNFTPAQEHHPAEYSIEVTVAKFREPALSKETRHYAKWGSNVGIGALLIGLAVTQRSILISYAFLLVGLMGASSDHTCQSLCP